MPVQLSTASLLALLLAAVRAGAWLVVSPPFNTKLIPGQVKALLAVAIAVPVTPSLRGHVPALGTATLLVDAVEQVVVGAALGFLTALLFAAVQAAGNLIDLFGGLSLAFAFDPLSASTNSVFGRFYNLIATTLLFGTGAHELVLRGFAMSYHTLPLDGTLSLRTLDSLLTTGLVGMFVSALQIAGPLLAVLFCADVALGLLSRVAPSLNAFALGFPLKILLTVSMVGAAIALLPQTVTGIVDQAVHAMVRVAGG